MLALVCDPGGQSGGGVVPGRWRGRGGRYLPDRGQLGVLLVLERGREVGVATHDEQRHTQEH